MRSIFIVFLLAFSNIVHSAGFAPPSAPAGSTGPGYMLITELEGVIISVPQPVIRNIVNPQNEMVPTVVGYSFYVAYGHLQLLGYSPVPVYRGDKWYIILNGQYFAGEAKPRY